MQKLSLINKKVVDTWMADPSISLVNLITKYYPKAKPHPPSCVRRFNDIMRKPEVEAYVAGQIKMLQEKVDVTLTDATRFLAGTLNANVSDFIDDQDKDHLKIKNLAEMDRSLTSQVKKLKIRSTTNTYDNGSEVKNTTIEFELYDKMQAIDRLAKALKWWEENKGGNGFLGVIVVPEGSTKEEQWAQYVQLPDGNQLIEAKK